MSLTDDFTTAAAQSKTMTRKPSNEELLDLYAWYKQSTDGDTTEVRPGGFDFKAIAKHDAWASRKGSGREEAMKSYIELVNSLMAKYT